MAETMNRTFEEFKEWILHQFAQHFNRADSNYIATDAFHEFGDRMLEKYQYTPEREQFLIQQTKIYIRCYLDRSLPHNTSTEFLEKLTNKIAAFMSFYIMNKYPIPEAGKSKNELCMRVQAEIKQILFDDNQYIIMLKHKQAINRAFRKKNKKQRKRAISEQRRQDAIDAYRYAQQIRGLFFEAQNTPRKKR